MIASGGESDACQNGAAALAGSCWNSISFAQMVALHAVAWGCEAGAIITEIWHVGHPLAPGERPSYQAPRAFAAARSNYQQQSRSGTSPDKDGRYLRLYLY